MKAGLRHRKIETKHGRAFSGMLVFLAICLAFGVGFWARGNDGLLTRIGMESLIVDSEKNPGMTVSGNTNDSISARVAEVQGILKDYSVDTYDLSTTTQSVLTSFVESTADPYTHYYNPEQYLQYQQQTAGAFEGVGVLLGDYNGQAYVVDVFEGSPAQAAGVQEGDFVASIDGVTPTGGFSLIAAIDAIDKDAGSTVVITWRRPASLEAKGGEEFTTQLQCTPINQVNVEYALQDNGVGYIKIHQLGRDTANYVQNAVQELTKQGAQAFVLDIRNVPGGYLAQAVKIASLFQRGGVVVQVEAKNATSKKNTDEASITDAPMMVLVNGNTAAAAEVLAGSLKDNDRATIVGETTMGKGTVQVIRELSFGGAISYTGAYYLTPNGREIQGNGITPDIQIQNPGTDDDMQLQTALNAAANSVR